MKTLILNGSPRRDGDIAALVGVLIKNLHSEYKVLDCYQGNLSPCVDCRSCREQLYCPIDDEMQEVYAYLAECDNVILASPVHYAELSSALLKVASRFQVYSSAVIFRHEKLSLHIKHGAVLLAQGGSGGADRAYETARLIFQSIGVTEVYPLVCSTNTDRLPAAEDEKVLCEIQKLTEWLNIFGDTQENTSKMP